MIDTDAASECAEYIKLRLVPLRPPFLMAFCWWRRLSIMIAAAGVWKTDEMNKMTNRLYVSIVIEWFRAYGISCLWYFLHIFISCSWNLLLMIIRADNISCSWYFLLMVFRNHSVSCSCYFVLMVFFAYGISYSWYFVFMVFCAHGISCSW